MHVSLHHTVVGMDEFDLKFLNKLGLIDLSSQSLIASPFSIKTHV